MKHEFICPSSVTSPWVCHQVCAGECVYVCVCMLMTNGGDYWGSEIRESIWLSWDDRRPLPLPTSHQGDTDTQTQTRTDVRGSTYSVCSCVWMCALTHVCEGQTAPPFTVRQMTQPSRCVCIATRRCDRLRQTRWMDSGEAQWQVSLKNEQRELSKLLRSWLSTAPFQVLCGLH